MGKNRFYTGEVMEDSKFDIGEVMFFAKTRSEEMKGNNRFYTGDEVRVKVKNGNEVWASVLSVTRGGKYYVKFPIESHRELYDFQQPFSQEALTLREVNHEEERFI